MGTSSIGSCDAWHKQLAILYWQAGASSVDVLVVLFVLGQTAEAWSQSCT